jgi:hypothetical protein
MSKIIEIVNSLFSNFWKKAFFVTLILSCNLAFSQEITLEAFVKDKNTNEVLPYATVYNKHTLRGTISNDEGFFRFPNLSISDTLLVSYLGYESLLFVVTSEKKESIFLTPKTNLLNEVVVNITDDFLYDLVSKCYKTNSRSERVGKTYFSLETFSDSVKIEMLDGYYNSTLKGYDVETLELKNGRLAINEYKGKVFQSMGTSKTFYMHRLFESNDYFPHSPLEYNKRNLRELYNLRLKSSHKNEQNRKVYEIEFTPKKRGVNLFSGSLWMDADNFNVFKISLEKLNTSIHPFEPLFGAELTNVDLNISKSFTSVGGVMHLQSTDFNYSISYISVTDSIESKVNSKAVLYVYDMYNEFDLPFFTYTDMNYIDYRKLNAAPYNSFFWENINEFTMNDKPIENERFREQAKWTSKNYRTRLNYNNQMFEHPFSQWQDSIRIYIKEEPKPFKEIHVLAGKPLQFYYNLKAHIYLDVNEFNDSVNVVTATVFDPFESFYHLKIDSVTNAFINMYFDLVEIHRQKLVNKMSVFDKLTIPLVKKLYKEECELLQENSQRFFKKVQRGTNENEMLKWNKYINTETGIDNLFRFGVYQLLKGDVPVIKRK